MENRILNNLGYQPLFHVNSINVHEELGKHILVDGFDFVLDYANSSEAHLVDMVTGTKLHDFFTFFASMPIGFNHPKLNNEAFVKYIGQIAINKPSNSDIYTEEMATFVKTLFNVAAPSYFKYAFFIDGGALAVENALKTAFDWKVRKNFNNGYVFERGHQVIHFKQAFHGRTGYTMSLTNTDPNKVNYYPKFNWPRITNPKMKFPMNEDNFDYTLKLEKQAIEEIKNAFMKNPDDIAAIIIEPIQSEGGDNHFRNEFMQKLRELADENQALLIFDEVQTGVGLTGSMWAHEQMGVIPDIMSFGKKMQTCGILVTDKIDDIPENVFHTSSRINSTWGGNLVDMVRSTRFLEIIHEENLVENAMAQGNYLHSRLSEMQQQYPGLLSNVRGRGLMCAFDFNTPEERNRFRDLCFKNNLIILGCGDKSIRFRPALNISKIHLDEGLGIVENALKEMSIF